ncbi:hypothetical protein GGX14DRAFT_388124 [Mycena pura]|uniref:Uncharacterized protein n=1 Tax=Mycena pura TaxID=153505 RepID=A0AAD7E005_9AGAR|nr:hypothetical protein GGX14DRAFT_388124 [Mycena pura]
MSRWGVASIIKITPDSVSSFLSGLKSSFGGTGSIKPVGGTSTHETSASSLLDVTSSDLASLVTLRRAHQTKHARVGVRNYKPLADPNAPTTTKVTSKAKPPPSEKQLLAQRIQSVVRMVEARKVTTGLNRQALTARTEGDAPVEMTQTDVKAGGNAANAALSAEVRATAAIQRRCKLAQTLNCASVVAKAGISPLLTPDDFVFVMERESILLGRVVTMYSKGGGKSGKHSWIPAATDIGKISYVVVQTYEHSAGRSFRRIHAASAPIGVSRFAHLSPGSVLVRIADTVNINNANGIAEISSRTAVLLKDLQKEKVGVVRMVTALNTVARAGKSNINIMDLEEEDDVAT